MYVASRRRPLRIPILALMCAVILSACGQQPEGASQAQLEFSVSTTWTSSATATLVHFSRPVNRESIAAALSVEPPLALELTWEGDALRIVPSDPLAPNTRYQFTLQSAALDAEGHPLGQDHTWAIRTDSPLSSLTRPVRQGDGSSPLAIRFKHSMDTPGVQQALRLEPYIEGEWHWIESDTVAMLAPAQPLPSGADYTVHFDGPLQAANGDTFAPAAPICFTTPPAILSVSPRGDSISTSATIGILFDRPMDHSRTEASVEVMPELPGRFVWQGAHLIFEPAAGLASSTVHTVTIATSAVGHDGTPVLQEPYVWSFQTSESGYASTAGTEAPESDCASSTDFALGQDIAVRPLVPSSLVAGDLIRLEAIVQNHSRCTRSIDVSLSSDGLAIIGTPTKPILLASGQQRMVSWMARAERLGETYAIAQAVSGLDADVARESVFVRSASDSSGQAAPAAPIAITRQYLDVETGQAAQALPQGQVVEIQLGLQLAHDLSGIVVEDRLPAGLEPIQAPVNGLEVASCSYNPTDASVSFTISELAAGQYTLSYLAQARYGGEFTAHAALAYETGNPTQAACSPAASVAIGLASRPALASPALGGGGPWWGDQLTLCTGGTDVPNDEAFDAMFFEEYGVNPFVDTDEDNLSTFAVDVDTGSYTIMRSYVERGELPPDEAVRVEEYVNFFDQGYTPPAEGEGAFSIDLEGAPSHFGSEAHRLVRIGLQGYMPSSEDRPDVVLTFVIDVSGSMSLETRLELVKDALELLVNELRPSDQIGIAVYGTNGRMLLRHTPVAESATILRAISRLQPEGATNAEEGLIIGYRMAAEAFDPQAIDRVILCSDGVANVGNTGADSIWNQIKDYAEQGIYLTTVGFGMGNYNDVLMEQLADRGDGFYAYVDTIEEAQRLFVDRLPSTLQVIARDARIQVEFNPAVIRSYRLIGYENRDIADEDFRDDEVDAGEIGIGHSVTALYEIKPWAEAAADETAITVYVRYENPDTGETSEISRTTMLGDFAPAFGEASTRFQLAAVVAEYAEVLRESFWATGSSLEAVLAQARRVADSLSDDEDVAEFVHLVERAAEISGQEDHAE